MTSTTAVVGALLTTVALLAGTPAATPIGGVTARAMATPTSPADMASAIPDVQLLTLDDDCDGSCQDETVARLSAVGCNEVRVFPTLRMASARCRTSSTKGGEGDELDLSRLPRVLAAAADLKFTTGPVVHGSDGDDATAAADDELPWGLDRINQESLPLDNDTTTACYPSRGKGVTVYVLDSGIRADHSQFGGRASGMVAPGSSLSTADDENGHGSHVAGIVAGETVGVAPAATIVGIRILDANGSGTSADVLSAIEYVAAIKEASRRAKIVMNMSFGHPGRSIVINAAVSRAVELGVIAVAAAGNWPIDACWISPGGAEGVITVAASTRNDRLARWSARGTECVAVAAPGVGILSVDASSQDGLVRMSGTSMASPHAAGLAALILAQDSEGGELKSDEVLDEMTRDAPTVEQFPLAWANPTCQ